MRRRIGILLLLAIGLALGAGLYLGGFHPAFEDASALAALIERAGPSAPVAAVLLFALLNALGFPGTVLVAAVVMTWSLPVAFLLSWLGAIGATVLTFGLARLIGRDWIETRLGARLRAYGERLASRPVGTVVVIRLVFFLNPLAHWFLALSPVSFPSLMLGSTIGFLPGMALTVFAGGSILDWMIRQPAWTWLVAGAVAVAILLIHRARVRARPATLATDA